jgi:hypothetical protein
MFSVDSVRQLIAELDGYEEMFERLDAQVSEWAEPSVQTGLTDEVLEESLKRTLRASRMSLFRQAGSTGVEKKLGRRQRLIQVWQFALDDGRKP